MIYNNLVISEEINECIFPSAHWTYLEHKGKKIRAEIISQKLMGVNFEQGVDLSINYLQYSGVNFLPLLVRKVEAGCLWLQPHPLSHNFG
jgi:hypothetical protein